MLIRRTNIIIVTCLIVALVLLGRANSSIKPPDIREQSAPLPTRGVPDCAASSMSGYWIELLNASTSPNLDTTDWNTYQNQTFNFELRHPKDWEIVVIRSDEEVLNVALNEEWTFAIGAARTGADPEAVKILAANCPTAKIGGQDAVVSSSDSSLDIYLQTGTHTYRLYDPRNMGQITRPAETKLIFEQIVRSFRLLH